MSFIISGKRMVFEWTQGRERGEDFEDSQASQLAATFIVTIVLLWHLWHDVKHLWPSFCSNYCRNISRICIFRVQHSPNCGRFAYINLSWLFHVAQLCFRAQKKGTDRESWKCKYCYVFSANVRWMIWDADVVKSIQSITVKRKISVHRLRRSVWAHYLNLRF